MRAMSGLLTLFTLTFLVNPGKAEMLNNNFKFGVQVGGTINASSGDRSEIFSHGAVMESDLYYMVTKNFGLVPASLRLQRFDFNKDRPELLEGHIKNLPDVIDINPSAWRVNGNAWGLAYLPGVYFTTGRDWPVNLFGQVGMGFYHYNEALEVYNFETDSAENDFATRFGGGLEANATDRLAVQTRVDYLWTDTNQARRNLVGITGGVTYHF